MAYLLETSRCLCESLRLRKKLWSFFSSELIGPETGSDVSVTGVTLRSSVGGFSVLGQLRHPLVFINLFV